MLIFKPGAERFGYFRLGDRVRRGEASPQEILDAQDLYDNHFHDSAAWRRFRSADAESRLLVLPPSDDPTPAPGREGDARWM